ncbi:aromatic ring-hydroxylating oxygenase subunit alpha [Noviherbaspirillum massiliense]|uniref:aromatic ring-hydroxylating dioxygenase subunit alpha n=1 Tax=Noviherbaspirillum massiliense TaxID=1465823 RepID=UPI0002F2A3FD|nr:aromatic ring-hydroxylating dioxygenase subunit alpha [Noviherbaspirillum massiliense]
MDPLLLNDWHPVADAAALKPGCLLPARLLEHELVLWRASDGTIHAWDDRCPHRGARLSLGRVANDRVVCAYHGWQFDASGQCRLQPAHPQNTPPRNACAARFNVQEAYGLAWVCLGDPERSLLPFPEYEHPGLRKVLCGPFPVHACGPRIIENFLDMAHFAFIHEGILGDTGHAEVPDYKVAAFDDKLGRTGMKGVIATACFAYQPQSNLQASGGSMVEYTYRVVRPLSAILTKLPQEQSGLADVISLHVQPIDEEHCQAWMVLATTDEGSSDEEMRDFQGRIFMQDLAILESQRPKRIPLQPGLEVPQPADRLSAAYRRMLRELGMKYGVM